MSAVTGLKTPSNRRIATTIVAVTVSLGIGFAAGGFLTGGFENDIRVPAAKVETVTPVPWDQGKIDALKVRAEAMQGLYEQGYPAWDQGKIDALKVRAEAMQNAQV
jgi:hypothetical protein